MTVPTAAPARRTRATLAITAAVVVALLIAFFIFAGLYADVLWFDQLGYLKVLLTEWGTITSLFVLGFLGMAVPVYVCIQLAYRLRPVYAKLTAQLDRYQQVIEPLRRIVMLAVPAVIGLFAAVSVATRWQPVLLFLHGGAVGGKPDPQFGLDKGFYLFQLPVLHGLVGYLSAVLVIALLASLATAYLYGAIRISGREIRVSRAARVQIAVVFAAFLLVQAVSLFLDQFITLYSPSSGDVFTGAGYADVNGVIPSRLILAVIALLVAALFIVTAAIGRWRLPLIGTGLLIVASIVAGSIYPWGLENLRVKPSGAILEKPFITRAIDGTREAYGVSGVRNIPYNATTTAQAGQLKSDATTTANIRIIDPARVSPTFAQFQQVKQYYQFNPTLDVDRYTLGGKTRDLVVGVRELDQANVTGATAFNDAFVYTHGYGLVAAYGNERASDGSPVFVEKNIPVTGSLGSFQPRVYFGEDSPTYSVVGAPKGSKPIELDYPSSSASSQASNTFEGSGGPSVGNAFNRLIYSLKFQSDQILLSSAVNGASQILYDRDPITRVQKAAPYLTLDSDPYPSVVNHHLVWIVDGYTTASSYPYSDTESLSNDIANTSDSGLEYPTDNINYLRNSVKATVDAYSGRVTLYAWDASDPVLKAWQNVFPNTVQPLSKMSSQLVSHVRYPEDMFRVQRTVLGRYHTTDPTSWYQQSDSWRTPPDPNATAATASDNTLQAPYYLTLQAPRQASPAYSIYSTYIPVHGTSNLTGYLVADANAGSKGGTKASDYGQLRLLELPKNVTVPGPGQVKNDFDSDTTVSSALNLLNRGETTTIRGNLLTLPVGGGLLYVQPVYVQSSGNTKYPLLRKVLVDFGGKVAFEDTLSEALNSVFGGDAGATTGDSGVAPSTGTTTPPATTKPGTNTALTKALNAASAALDARQAAYKKGDLVAAAEADAKLQTALKQAESAAG